MDNLTERCEPKLSTLVWVPGGAFNLQRGNVVTITMQPAYHACAKIFIRPRQIKLCSTEHQWSKVGSVDRDKK